MKREYRNAIRTKKMIREAFTLLLGEKKSIAAITVGELSERADVAKSTFYNHYEDIYAVAEEFEDELIEKLSAALDGVEKNGEEKYEEYFFRVIEFLKENEDIYCKAIISDEAKFFVEKLKNIIVKKIFSESINFHFSSNPNEKYVQIRFLTNACIDTVTDYFKGYFDASLDTVGEIVLAFLKKCE